MTVLPLAVLILLLTVTVAVLATLTGVRGRTSVASTGRLAAVAVTTGRGRLAGLLVGVVVGVVAARQGLLGRGPMLAAPLLALCVLLGVVVGELRVPPPQGTMRAAGIEVRRVSDYLPRVLGPAVAAGTVLLGVLLVLTSAWGSEDDLGRPGRSLARVCSATAGEARGPWPGSYYSLPLAGVVLFGLVVAGFAVAKVVVRPREGENAQLDDALRRSSVTTVTAAVGLLVTVPLVGAGAFAASGLLGICAPPVIWSVVGCALLVVIPLALGLGLWCAALLLVPARPVPAGAVR